MAGQQVAEAAIGLVTGAAVEEIVADAPLAGRAPRVLLDHRVDVLRDLRVLAGAYPVRDRVRMVGRQVAEATRLGALARAVVQKGEADARLRRGWRRHGRRRTSHLRLHLCGCVAREAG